MMDEMMGGEGSESLASAHRAMGSRYLSFLQDGAPNNMMMGGMMGGMSMGQNDTSSHSATMGMGRMMGTMQPADSLASQMSQYCQMMTSDFGELETHFEKMMQIQDMKTLKAEMQKHHDMMMTMQSRMNGQRQMCQNMMSMMSSMHSGGMGMHTMMGGSTAATASSDRDNDN
jgi:hypothetical protein